MTIDEYIEQLSEKEKIAYITAMTILKSSFDISKSIGYLKKVQSSSSK
jgi:hypothetical protein